MADIYIMELYFDDMPDAICLQTEGIINCETLADFRDKLDTHLEQGKTKILLDFENLKHITSKGFSYLVFACEKVKAQGGFLVLAKVQEEVMQVFETLKLTEYFNFADSDAEVSKLFC